MNYTLLKLLEDNERLRIKNNDLNKIIEKQDNEIAALRKYINKIIDRNLEEGIKNAGLDKIFTDILECNGDDWLKQNGIRY